MTDVLLVDFFDAARSSTTEVLAGFGLTVVEADDGEIALELLTRMRFGVVLLDPDLPKLSGVELIESLDDLPPVIMLSRPPTEPDDEEQLEGKVVAYLSKPVHPSVLIRNVNAVLKGGRLAA